MTLVATQRKEPLWGKPRLCSSSCMKYVFMPVLGWEVAWSGDKGIGRGVVGAKKAVKQAYWQVVGRVCLRQAPHQR
jgi:hypothetical protein